MFWPLGVAEPLQRVTGVVRPPPKLFKMGVAGNPIWPKPSLQFFFFFFKKPQNKIIIKMITICRNFNSVTCHRRKIPSVLNNKK
jgi:hypothetical protein